MAFSLYVYTCIHIYIYVCMFIYVYIDMHISPAPRASGPQGPARDAKSEKLQTCFFCVVWLKCNNNRCFSVCALYVAVRMHLYVYIYIYEAPRGGIYSYIYI